ncbi:hypothetical protein JQN72_10630 [Phycicoccus sp. CSK15P-2]|uniref:hypothetical protein n=1 Tax=Phycicoccus sp. CSK15P-2 TaxID=2807627 RepID=UPI00194E12D2|nr:hypothetical protein [Phycicoccus sp. CSK15P-2]MBM6404696.1 hypothetical protein [Phycicoccus sp. CSK15P-2]
MPPVDPSRPGRRTLLSGATALGVGLLGGCGIRLEDDAPQVPLVPARSPVAGEDHLTEMTRESAALAHAAGTAPGEVAAGLVAVHQRQVTVLRTTLLRRRVPADAMDVPPSPGITPSPTAPSPTAPVPTARAVATLGAAEAAGLVRAGEAAGVVDDLLGPAVAVHAQRFAAASLLGVPSAQPPAVAVDGDVVADLVDAVDAVVYFLQVAAARSDGARRKRADATLGSLGALRVEVAAGGVDPSPALGHPLPFAVEGGAAVDRLARTALGDLRATLAASVGALVEAHDAAGAAASVRWLGATEVETHRWGLPLAPFPGLT